MKKPKIVDGQPVFDHECKDCGSTPIPWEAGRTKLGDSAIYPANEKEPICIFIGEDKGNADFIVRAVNSYEMTQKAIRELESMIKSKATYSDMEMVIVELHDAIATAEGK